jgi:hypothetical protein
LVPKLIPRDIGLPFPIPGAGPMYDPVELKLWSWSALVFWMEMAYPVDDEGGDRGYMDGLEKDWRRALGCFV